MPPRKRGYRNLGSVLASDDDLGLSSEESMMPPRKRAYRNLGSVRTNEDGDFVDDDDFRDDDFVDDDDLSSGVEDEKLDSEDDLSDSE
jgi:hypothetical protein